MKDEITTAALTVLAALALPLIVYDKICSRYRQWKRGRTYGKG